MLLSKKYIYSLPGWKSKQGLIHASLQIHTVQSWSV